MRLTKAQQQVRADALGKLREVLTPGTTIYTVLRKVSASGMRRHIGVVIVAPPDTWRNTPHVEEISHLVARALNIRRDDRTGGLVLDGCGQDIGFALVHELSYALHGNVPVGDAAAEANRKGIPFTPTATSYRPGYSLRHEWL